MERPALIYWLLALHLTIVQANRFLDNVGLTQFRITEANQIADVSIFSPADSVDASLTKSILTTNFHFTISKEAFIFTRLKEVHLPRTGVEDWNDADGTMGMPKDSASEAAAYRLAWHWLEGAGFDVPEMEKEYPAWVDHGDLPLKNRHQTSGRFAVRWGRKGEVTGTNCAAMVKLNLRDEWLVSIYVTHLRYLRAPLPEVSHGEDINRLPDTPVRDFLGIGPGRPVTVALRQPAFSFTNAFQLLNTPDAYWEQMALAMHRTVSELASRLHSECLLDNLRTNLKEAYVDPPAFGSGGRLGSNDVEVRFDTAGRLSYFSCLPAGYTNWRQWEAAATPLISSNQAFTIATQAVADLSIDMARLDRDCERVFSRGGGMKRDTKGKMVQNLTPRFWLWWADTSAGRRRPVVMIGVCGDSGQIRYVELKDTTYYNGPTLPVSAPEIPKKP